ncbi:MAG: TetR/AcrR family transcriptional regulator [Comamonadaceae bacterium]|nr:MAG: TetR/AcrR family transcriptional regulator [Comamonadaceae bacterium]
MPAKTSEVKQLRKPRGPGRPGGTSVVRDEILDAAETVFSNLGYAGTSLREVAEKARVTQALISYYFGSKFGLFEQAFLRRSEPISLERIERLEALQNGGFATPHELVRAFLLPTVSLRASPQGRAFLRLQARLHTEPPEISYELRTRAYGGSTGMYVDALRAAIPGLSELDAHWRVAMMVGTYLYAFSDTHRLEEMTRPGIYDSADTDSLIEQVTRFVVGGLEAA